MRNYMTPENIINAFENIAESKPHSNWIRSNILPAIEIELCSKDTSSLSKLGGQPLLPNNFEWPEPNVGEYQFLGQFNFAEMPQTNSNLPKSGLLSLFYNYEENGEAFWGDDGFVIAYFFPNIENLTLIQSPNQLISPETPISFSLTASFPLREEVVENWPFDYDVINEIEEELSFPSNYFLGHPLYNTLAYNPCPGPNWTQLLNLSSIEQLNWCWHDGDRLLVFIENEKLSKNDFSCLKCDAG